ncbi:hypothetical protein [Hymenobacter cheonanensis]|uniref:hypothetical protein n=1 Tax=Hymenobacter sp. CA2-7 TaxID=3063993 RepID=UPI00271354E6|nr:hypothetical protein [Hymenobacter sp. CA2-7]MDO7885328.1 hypothetical protein [Hymenobacter sp. CA2-7]
MTNLPRLQRDLVEIENNLRLTRNRLACYELLDDSELAAHTKRVIEGLESTKEVLTIRIQGITNEKVY